MKMRNKRAVHQAECVLQECNGRKRELDGEPSRKTIWARIFSPTSLAFGLEFQERTGNFPDELEGA